MSGRGIALPNRASVLLAAVAVVFWMLGYFRDNPLLDAIGSVFMISALVVRWAHDDAAD